ncbi:signal peptidase II [Hydrogenimonas sp.]
MRRAWIVFLLALTGIYLVDQGIKSIFLAGWRWESDCLSLTLVYNRGVAFSMFAFLGPWLKWMQLAMLGGVLGYVLHGGYLTRYSAPLGILFGAGLSNVSDRFVHGGVVDYVAWHCGFDFAVFNFADVMIDLAVLWILVLNLRKN